MLSHGPIEAIGRGRSTLRCGLHRVVRARVNPRPIALLRMVFGALVLLRGVYFVEQARLATDAGQFAIAGSALPGAGVALVAVWAALGVALMVGWHSRAAAGAYAALVFALLAADPLFYNNHLYLMGLVAALLACSDCGAAFSLDSRHREAITQVPGWPAFLLRAQVSIVYAFAALSKVHEAFLSGHVLHVHLSRGPFAPLLPSWLVSNFLLLVSVAVVVIGAQMTLVWALWSPRWQNAAFTIGFLLHAPMVLLANSWHQALRLFIFSLLMWALYLLFLRVPVEGRTLRWDPADPTAAAAAALCRRLDLLQAVSFVANSEDACPPPDGEPSMKLWDLEGTAYTGVKALQRVLAVLPASYLWASVCARPMARRTHGRVGWAVGSQS